jgi:single-strand DNA-binding protein
VAPVIHRFDACSATCVRPGKAAPDPEKHCSKEPQMPREATVRRTDDTAAQASDSQNLAPDEGRARGENTVVLVGKVSGGPADRQLPSGDMLVTWRLVVRRPPPARRRMPEGVRQTSVDTIDCASWRGDVRRAVTGWSDGDVVRVEGSLRRRFWRTAVGTASRCEVEVTRVRRLSRARS